MEYMFLIYGNEAELARATPEETAKRQARSWAILEEAQSRGVFKGARPLKPSAATVTVRSSGDKISITDGPFAETKEALGGYWILECADLSEAKEWGLRLSKTGCAKSVEIRELAALPLRTDVPNDVERAHAVNA